jgi:hypothetical protein
MNAFLRQTMGYSQANTNTAACDYRYFVLELEIDVYLLRFRGTWYLTNAIAISPIHDAHRYGC